MSELPMREPHEYAGNDSVWTEKAFVDTRGTYKATLVLTGPDSITEIELVDGRLNPLDVEVLVDTRYPEGFSLADPLDPERVVTVKLKGKLVEARWERATQAEG